ncbi:MAG: helix-turn-helix domain-containing protein [Chloroflexota bacterium]
MNNRSSFLSRDPAWTANLFFGRQNALNWIDDKLGRETPQNCNITAEPRQGKTSFLYQIYDQKIGLRQDASGLYVWVRLVELSAFDSQSFWRFMIERFNTAVSQAGFSPIEDLDEFENANELFDELDEAIELLTEDDQLNRLVFVIDDFDVLIPTLTSRDLDWLRALANRYRDTLAFVIGSTDSLVSLTEQIVRRESGDSTQAISPFANFFHNLPLGLLAQSEAIALCECADDLETAVALNEEDIQFLLKEAGRHPDLLKMGLGHLVSAKLLSDPDEIYEDTAGDLRFDEHAKGLSRQLFDRLSSDERTVVLSLANENGESELDRILLNQLKRHVGLIEKRNGRMVPFADTFKYWVTRFANEDSQPKPEQPAAPEEEEMFQYIQEQRTVKLANGTLVRLTPLENRLLVYFIEHANQVCTIGDLLKNVWGPNKSRAVVEKAVNRLRTKIETDPKRPRYILSARGEGYLLRYEATT